MDAGQIHTQEHVSGSKNWDDRFGHSAEASNSKGSLENTSILRFYEGELPGHFVVGGVQQYAGPLPASVTAPDFWEYRGTAHTINLEWDLTSSDKKDWWWQYTVRRGNQQRSESWGKVPPGGLSLP